jgi:2',3'-cyclic-nucleotide 2'-phosphodiesterase
VRILFLGDIVGTPGQNLVKRAVPELKAKHALDLVIVNAENIAAGSGIFPSNLAVLLKAGVDGVTLGDHGYRRAEIVSTLRKDHRIVRPANYPATAPGADVMFLGTSNQVTIAVVSLLGRLFMKPVDCPIQTLERLLPAIRERASICIVDFHAEATGEKYTLYRAFDGRVSAIFGTHTHVPTADLHISNAGTAFQCDVGMCGGHAGILGRKAEPILDFQQTHVPYPFPVEEEDVRLNGVIVECEGTTGKAERLVYHD